MRENWAGPPFPEARHQQERDSPRESWGGACQQWGAGMACPGHQALIVPCEAS